MIDYNVTNDDLDTVFELKYGRPESAGWSPRRRYEWGYYRADDVYEAMVSNLVFPSTKWVDIGGGRAVFPDNGKLSDMLAKKCQKLVAVDPSKNVFENPFAHEKVNSFIEDFNVNEKFDLATFRMVAEHIDCPEATLRKLRDLVTPGGHVIIYTINKFSPIPIITFLTPFSIHYKVKKLLWGGEEKDTFPVAYKMNTRADLKRLFLGSGFDEVYFSYLSDLSAFGKFKLLNLLELSLWKALKNIGITYPENNILAVYRRR
ncbi:methyltransferase domain-containing protein [Marinobacter sp. chi1]|uniref:Methyltransferase domain-containing protein n=1 Tax=Marinobacter suaedae TaxID=3057675 RepID=A0ABT8W2X5_9GAMM|nr:methyltransferase domain-containing protein [Marinobacter sp. chi1]MDO3722580.1 methyltransferase domain-containing protein [Marinobacter sp. chi1]